MRPASTMWLSAQVRLSPGGRRLRDLIHIQSLIGTGFVNLEAARMARRAWIAMLIVRIQWLSESVIVELLRFGL